MKSSALVKHLFWILAGTFAVLLFVGFLLMWVIGGGAAAAKEKERTELLAKVSTAQSQAKGKGVVVSLEEQREKLEGKTSQFWKENYDRQKQSRVFDWPVGGQDAMRRMERADFPFGASFPTPNGELQPAGMKRAFDNSYQDLPKLVAPTRFPSAAPSSALRQVSDWGVRNLTTDHLWLAVEDYWVQKALLRAIAEVNNSAAVFADVTPKGADGGPARPNAWVLRNRTWDLELTVETVGVQSHLHGRLRNRTGRLQVLGARKEMVVKLWFDDPSKGKPIDDPLHLVSASTPFAYRIEGEVVPGYGSMDVKFDKAAHALPGGAPEKIHLAVQDVDEATVPVRLVEKIELGARDNRRTAATLVSLARWGADEPPADPTGGGGPSAAGSGVPGPGDPSGRPPPGGASGAAAGGSADAVLLGNKKRYLESTKEVRRMPVGLAVVLDADFQNDLLVALGNSPLRMQVTQTEWQRFRGDLGRAPTPGTDGGAAGSGGVAPPPGSGGGKPGGVSVGIPAPAGSGGGGGAFPAASSGGGEYSSTGGTGGLVEVAVYGLITLYERYEPPAATPDAAPPPAPTTEPGPPQATTTTSPAPSAVGTATPAPTPVVSPATTTTTTAPAVTPATTPK